MSRRVLVVDDEAGHRLMLRAVLAEAGWQVQEAADGAQARAALADLQLDPAAPCPAGADLDVVLLDLRLPDASGLELLAEFRAQRPDVPVIMLTAYGSVGSAVEAMKQGAFDYLTKPADNDELEAVLAKASDYRRLLRENIRLRARVSQGPEMVGDGPAMRQVAELVAQVAPSEATVLITGESGTGKELVAELLHRGSPRAAGPLVKVNCAALPAELLESELFGYVRGAFTGAARDKPGRFQLARGGTLLLDEVGELPMALQAKLLRALQERVVEPLGAVAPVPTDVRILAATNRHLPAEIIAGRFREDLYFRLNVIEIHLPPLRQRLEDLPALVGRLLARLGEKNHKRVRSVSPEFLAQLGRYRWPGNIRELENVLERAIILARTDQLTPELLPPQVLQALLAPQGVESRAEPVAQPEDPEARLPAAGQPSTVPADATRSLDDAERAALVQALAQHGGHRERTADALGLSRRTLQYKLKKYGLTRR